VEVGRLAAKTGSTGVIEPTQAEIIHPPDLWLHFNSDIDANVCQVLEGVVKSDWGERAVFKSASCNSVVLGGDQCLIARSDIVFVTGKREVAVWALGVAAERGSVEVESETAS
jgi:hypothetical protein